MLASRFTVLARRFNYGFIHGSKELAASNVAATPTKDKQVVEDLDVPVKFTTSGARHWKAEASRLGYENVRLWYEPYVILGSIAIFLIYFGILREENDVDEELKKSLYSRIQGLEEYQLKASLEFQRDNNLDTSATMKRLEQLEREKSELK